MEHTSATLSDLVTNCGFLNIDTDGYDVCVLHGTEQLLWNLRPLEIPTEADLHKNPRKGDHSLAGSANSLVVCAMLDPISRFSAIPALPFPPNSARALRRQP